MFENLSAQPVYCLACALIDRGEEAQGVARAAVRAREEDRGVHPPLGARDRTRLDRRTAESCVAEALVGGYTDEAQGHHVAKRGRKYACVEQR